MGNGAMALVRWCAAVAALAAATLVAVGALTGPGGERPAPIEVAASAVPGGDGALREVEPARLRSAGGAPDAADGTAGATPGDPATASGTTAATDATGSSTTTVVPGLGTVTGPATDPLAGLLAPLPLVGTTTTTTAPGATTTTSTLLPGLPPLPVPLPPLPTIPLLPWLGG